MLFVMAVPLALPCKWSLTLLLLIVNALSSFSILVKERRAHARLESRIINTPNSQPPPPPSPRMQFLHDHIKDSVLERKKKQEEERKAKQKAGEIDELDH